MNNLSRISAALLLTTLSSAALAKLPNPGFIENLNIVNNNVKRVPIKILTHHNLKVTGTLVDSDSIISGGFASTNFKLPNQYGGKGYFSANIGNDYQISVFAHHKFLSRDTTIETILRKKTGKDMKVVYDKTYTDHDTTVELELDLY